MKENILEIRHLSKTFGDHEVLKDIDFTVHSGDVTSIIGASGSGKSTLLRCVNLLETPTSGQVLFHGQDVTAAGNNPNAYRAKVGMVFQSFNLFNNMTVLKNCMVGQMKVLKKSKAEAEENALRYLEQVGMDPYVNAKPRQLSGGMQQRVMIALTILQHPELIIADEITTAVDAASEYHILNELERLRQAGVSMIVVTHDFGVAARLCDRVAVMKDGEIIEEGKTQEVFSAPNHEYTRRLVQASVLFQEELC